VASMVPTSNHCVRYTACYMVTIDVVNHTKFGDDRSVEYKVMESQILCCFIGMACRI